MLQAIIDLGGKSLLKTQNYSLRELLAIAYPEKKIDLIKAKSSLYKKSQYLLHTMLKTMFPKDGPLIK
jgi:hypothetical protein